MQRTDGVSLAAVFFRCDADVLLTRYRGPIEAFENKWTTTTVSVDATSRAAVRERLVERFEGPPETTLVRIGEPYSSSAGDERGVTVYPALFECSSRGIETATEGVWVAPTEMLRRETIPRLWEAYDRVRPTPGTLKADTEHGSGYLSIRAMEIVRDVAGRSAMEKPTDEWAVILEVAEDVLTARPSMAALTNRMNRILFRASEDRTAAAVESIATEEIETALDVDRRAASEASSIVEDGVIFTLSRSGTVLPALTSGPERVVIAESRPGREGVAVAERISDAGTDVTICIDAAVAATLASEPIDAVLIGADTVCRDGTLVNKVGSRGAAIAAAVEGIPVYVVTATDKISPNRTPTLEHGPNAEVYDGDRRIDVRNPTFDSTPPEYVTGFITERGLLDPTEVADVAAAHAKLTAWSRR